MSGHVEIEFIGNVGGEPHLHQTENSVVTNFSVAVNESYKKADGEKVTTTSWLRVSAWNGLGDFANSFIGKGRKVFIKGVPKADFFVDKKGVINPVINVRATKIRLLDSAQEQEVTNSPNAEDFDVAQYEQESSSTPADIQPVLEEPLSSPPTEIDAPLQAQAQSQELTIAAPKTKTTAKAK